MGPRAIRILQTYWFQITMVAKSGGYNDPPSKVFRGVTQGNPLSPTIFNISMDAVMHHWVAVVAEY